MSKGQIDLETGGYPSSLQDIQMRRTKIEKLVDKTGLKLSIKNYSQLRCYPLK